MEAGKAEGSKVGVSSISVPIKSKDGSENFGAGIRSKVWVSSMSPLVSGICSSNLFCPAMWPHFPAGSLSFGASKHSGERDCSAEIVETVALTTSNPSEGVLRDSDLGLNWNRHGTGGMGAFMLLTP